MSSPHFATTFRNSCFRAPRNPNTGLPSTILERESLDFTNSIDTSINQYPKQFSPQTSQKTREKLLRSYESAPSLQNDFYYHGKPTICEHEKEARSYLNFKNRSLEKSNDQSSDSDDDDEEDEGNENRKHDNLSTMRTFGHNVNKHENLKNLINDDNKFLLHLQTLRKENQKTLNSLEILYNTSLNKLEKSKNNKTAKNTRYNRSPEHNQTLRENYRSIAKYTGTPTKDILREKYIDMIFAERRSPDLQSNGKVNHEDASPTIGHPFDSYEEKEEKARTASSPDTSKNLNDSIETCNKVLIDAMIQQEELLAHRIEGKKRKESELDDTSDDDTSSTEEDELDEQLKVRAPKSHVNILPESSSSTSFRGRSSSFDVIASMWEDFSIDEYAPYKRRPKSKPIKQKVWSPRTTIPRPFRMTLRDEGKTKSKTIEKIEQEKFHKQLQEEAELHIRTRPTPVPPTTFLPLYEELKEQENQRRQYVRDLSKKILKSSEKPFSFMQRENMKKEMKKSRSLNNVQKRDRKEKQRKQFKANPFPENLFDLTLADKMAEQEVYRKIKIELRSQETLANSSYPLSMKTRSKQSRRTGPKTEHTKENLKKRSQKSFQPQIHRDIPDFEQLQKQFENQVARQKLLHTPTISEPFELHTEKVPSRRRRFLESINAKKEDQSLSKTVSTVNMNRNMGKKGGDNVKRPPSKMCTDEPPSFSHTETSRLREELLRESLNRTRQEELQQTLRSNKKRDERKQLQQNITKKALAQDPSRNRRKETKEKMKSFKEADYERRKEYNEYLVDVNKKVRKQPLLFERESQTNARRKAQRRYEEILKEAGIEGDTLESFLENSQTVKSDIDRENSTDSENDDELHGSNDDDDDSNHDSDGSYTRYSEQFSDEEESVQGESSPEKNYQRSESEGETEYSGSDYQKNESDDGSYIQHQRTSQNIDAHD